MPICSFRIIRVIGKFAGILVPARIVCLCNGRDLLHAVSWRNLPRFAGRGRMQSMCARSLLSFGLNIPEAMRGRVVPWNYWWSECI